jgi:hypothetical protein
MKFTIINTLIGMGERNVDIEGEKEKDVNESTNPNITS